MTSNVYRSILFVAALAATLSVASTASAIPEFVPIQGFLTDDEGSPVDGTVPMTFRFYNSAVSPDVMWFEDVDVTLDDGHFVYELGLTAILELSLFAGADVWLGIEVNDTGEFDDRVQLGTVPYAAVAASTPWDGVTGVPADLADGDDDTTYTGAPPIVVSGSTISLSNTGCDAGDTWVFNGASWACSPVTAFTAGSGISFDGTTLAVDSTVQRRVSSLCPANEYMYGVTAGGTPICRADQDTPSTYTGGFGVNVSGNTIVADTSEVQRIPAAHDCQYGIRSISPAGVVTCAANNDTTRTYSPGFGITISGNTISARTDQVQQRIAPTNCPHGIRAIASNGGITCASAPAPTTYSPGFGLALSGSNQFSVTSAIQQNIAGTSCAYGIRQIDDNGTVHCAGNNDTNTWPNGFANCANAWYYMSGIAANGEPRCDYMPHRIRDWTNSNCVYTIGWSDSNRGCCDYLMHTNTHYGQRGGFGRTWGWYWDGFLGHFASIGTSGNVDDNDWFWHGYRCH